MKMSAPSGSFASTPQVRQRMQAVRRRDTAPELALRRLLWQRGLRYLVDSRPLPGLRRKADVVFPRRRVAIFVDGCYWHACPTHGTQSQVNQEYWRGKLKGNVERDRDTDSALTAAGWLVIRIWEHEAPDDAAARVEAVVRGRPSRPGAST